MRKLGHALVILLGCALVGFGGAPLETSPAQPPLLPFYRESQPTPAASTETAADYLFSEDSPQTVIAGESEMLIRVAVTGENLPTRWEVIARTPKDLIGFEYDSGEMRNDTGQQFGVYASVPGADTEIGVIEIVAVGDGMLGRHCITVEGGAPKPPPKPDPDPHPDPDPTPGPIDREKAGVLIIHDPNSMRPDDSIGAEVWAYLRDEWPGKFVVTTESKPDSQLKLWPQWWQDVYRAAMADKQSLPWLLITDGEDAVSVPLAIAPQDAIDQINGVFK